MTGLHFLYILNILYIHWWLPGQQFQIDTQSYLSIWYVNSFNKHYSLMVVTALYHFRVFWDFFEHATPQRKENYHFLNTQPYVLTSIKMVPNNVT